MRIVAGRFRSRTLLSARGLALRPTSDRLRETLFNILGARVNASTFVDVFAGTGAVGIEALSRGASRAVFIEKHAATAELIRKNLRALSVPVAALKGELSDRNAEEIGAAEIIRADADAALAKLSARGFHADLIFADPPYVDARKLEGILKFIAHFNLLNPRGLFMAEHSSRVSLPEFEGKLRRARVLLQGDSAISFFEFQI